MTNWRAWTLTAQEGGDGLPHDQRTDRGTSSTRRRRAPGEMKAHTGFEPVSQELRLPEPLRRKLAELRLQSDTRVRRGRE